MKNYLLNAGELTTLPPGWHNDGDGLALQVSPEGARSWVVKVTIKGSGARPTIGIGGLRDVSLKEARLKRDELRQIARSGRDPRQEARDEAHQDKIIPTFGAFADERMPTFKAGIKSVKTMEKWDRDLGKNADPIRSLRIDKITTAEVLNALLPHMVRAPAMGRELRQRWEKVFSAAIALEVRPRELGNPAALKDNLIHLLPRLAARGKLRGPQPSMPFDQLPAFAPKLRAMRNTTAKALLFTILTCMRTDEARELTWAEIDFDNALITIAGKRMKNDLEAIVPLSAPALAILRDLEANKTCKTYVFAGRKAGQPISSDSMIKLLQRGQLKRPDCTVHGFRSSFRTWGQDETTHEREALEFCLHHIEGEGAERSYKRGQMLKKRRAIMDDWAAFCLPAKPDLRVVAA